MKLTAASKGGWVNNVVKIWIEEQVGNTAISTLLYDERCAVASIAEAHGSALTLESCRLCCCLSEAEQCVRGGRLRVPMQWRR